MSIKSIQRHGETWTLPIWRDEPNPNPAAWLVVEEADPGLFEG